MLLEPEQEELLAIFVEATRKVPRADRYFFTISSLGTGDIVQGAGLDESAVAAPKSDVEVLANAGLLHVTNISNGSIGFVVAPEGFAAYEQFKQGSAAPMEQVEADAQSYFDSESFKARYPLAHRLWSAAAEIVWRAESEHELTTIGHKAREAMQAFATELVERYQPPEVNPDPAKTLDRVSAVIKMRADGIGEAQKVLLDALFAYWRALNGVVQRQEHGAQKEGQSLTWEDGRRVVFHAISAMTELDRTL